MDLVLSGDQIAGLEQIMEEELLKRGARHAFLVDFSGNLITEGGELLMEDLLPLAALTAANFGATERMAGLIGEKDFTLLFHKGNKSHIHFSRVEENFILVTVFGNDVPLGMIRLGSGRAREQMSSLLRG
jgi:predicted regulator of Ras-like GTPase activity (Roadblock/LC7/MglB family)